MEVQQRQFARKRPAQLVYLELGPGNGGMLTAASEEGFRFRAVSPVRPEVQVQFAFTLDGNQRLEGLGVVEDLEDDCKSGGIRFTEVSEQFRLILRNWLHADSSSSPSGRESAPAASVPLDTMEKIREELRAGRPRPPQADDRRQAEASIPAVPAFSAPSAAPVERRATPEEKKPRRTAVPDAAPPSRPKPRPSVAAAPAPTDVQSLRRLFHAPATSDVRTSKPPQPQEAAEEPQPVEQPGEISSAFLRPTSPEYHQPLMPVRAVLNEPANQVRADQTARPYIPPLEESFEQAWERARLTAPPESPQLSRATASSIITVALLVILGAVAYNFREDIGTTFILLGRSISGQNQAAPPSLPVPQVSNSGSGSASGQSEQKSAAVDAPSQSDIGGKSFAENPGGGEPSSGETSAPARSTQASKPATGAPDVPIKSAKPESPVNSLGSKPANNSPPSQSVADPATAAAGPIESPTGEAEFDVARELLHGPNRQVDLRRSVDLLWAAVRKGYVPAEVTLADLYRRGDGVPRNCDQAAVLLTAASKKGSTDARRMLELMAEQGCQ